MEASPVSGIGSPDAGFAYSGNRLDESHQTTIVVRLPDGRVITYTRNFPRLPLGL